MLAAALTAIIVAVRRLLENRQLTDGTIDQMIATQLNVISCCRIGA
jgi:hypothetical protein